MYTSRAVLRRTTALLQNRHHPPCPQPSPSRLTLPLPPSSSPWSTRISTATSATTSSTSPRRSSESKRTERAVKEGKEERKAALPANGAFVAMVCRSLIRAYVAQKQEGEEQDVNARELRAIADRHFGKNTVDGDIAQVMMGR
ncbi:hypothetical protein LTR53_014065 [Teratosphaeriaceae sp. CCFEE 6253]|nr:hypothetical protein LTR53_014065 [Teratosphaeriaceae sp. CCFEE 6253]